MRFRFMFNYQTFQVRNILIFSFTIIALFTIINVSPAKAFDVSSFPVVDDIIYDTQINKNDTLFVYKKSPAPSELNELREERTPTIQKYKTDNPNNFILKVYPSPQFIKDISGNWYHLEYAIASTSDFELEYSPVWDIIDKIQAYLYDPFLIFNIKSAIAQTLYSGGGDGTVGYYSSTWSTVHNASAGNDTNYTNNYMQIQGDRKNGSTYYIYRGFIPFDTSSLDDSDVITGADLYLYHNNDSGQAGVTLNHSITIANQSSVSSLINDDFDQAGSSVVGDFDADFDNSGGEEYVITISDPDTNISKTGYTKLGIRETNHDLADVAATNDYYFGIRSSEYTGTTYDPHLIIDYTVSEPAQTSTTSPATSFSELIEGIYASNDITIFSSYEEEYNATGTLIGYKRKVTHAPIIWILIVGFAIIYLFQFIYWQIQHRLESRSSKKL